MRIPFPSIIKKSQVKRMNKSYIPIILALMFITTGCVEVGQTTGGVELCTGDSTECGDNHDESDSSVSETTTN
jgi:hypothetical protein